MNRKAIATMILGLFTVPASAQDSAGCSWGLSMKDVSAAFGPDVRVQPVFANGAQKGWRLYGTNYSTQLNRHAVSEGTLMTHVCGVTANQVLLNKGRICSAESPEREFEIRVRSHHQERSIRIKRA